MKVVSLEMNGLKENYKFSLSYYRARNCKDARKHRHTLTYRGIQVGRIFVQLFDGSGYRRGHNYILNLSLLWQSTLSGAIFIPQAFMQRGI